MLKWLFLLFSSYLFYSLPAMLGFGVAIQFASGVTPLEMASAYVYDGIVADFWQKLWKAALTTLIIWLLLRKKSQA
ncbi:hypothetical protein AV540_07790 [Brevibacillus parabrevis]|uniref:hypothetical protein n=1 Tax=Brevibacillus parabrevis TaxID=54914 RepID=UPI0007ABF97C|nr:hypothetical protein [Brevibacillus parabrevis]KZE54113.1 hypothetical protein AV540_07790 [Brevibacillus parabrevis]